MSSAHQPSSWSVSSSIRRRQLWRSSERHGMVLILASSTSQCPFCLFCGRRKSNCYFHGFPNKNQHSGAQETNIEAEKQLTNILSHEVTARRILQLFTCSERARLLITYCDRIGCRLSKAAYSAPARRQQSVHEWNYFD